ncbi:MAG: hypothetical protein IPK82_43640 [Polyangiaceae bacterium]|nr:hypothetical protein [Polyangiaceae bacterium]
MSSPAGHASIYLGVKGPVLTTSDISLSMGTALLSSADLLVADEADVVVASTVAERDRIVENVVGPRTYGRGLCTPPLSPGAAAFVLEHERDGREALCVLHDYQDGTNLSDWVSSEPPAEPALVVLPRPSADWDEALDRSPWRAVKRLVTSRRAGSNEASLAVALGAGIAALARGGARAVLVVDHWREPSGPAPSAPARWAAFTFVKADA